MNVDAETLTIRKVKVLKGRAKDECDKQQLQPEDLVIVKTTYNRDSPPEYSVEKLEGDPISALLKRASLGRKETNKEGQ